MKPLRISFELDPGIEHERKIIETLKTMQKRLRNVYRSECFGPATLSEMAKLVVEWHHVIADDTAINSFIESAKAPS